jgi:serine O-acetyltransferase
LPDQESPKSGGKKKRLCGGMFTLIRSDIARYNRSNSPILLAAIHAAYTHPSFVGVIWYRIERHLWLRRENPIYFIPLLFTRALYPLIRIYSGLELSPKAQIGPGLYVGHFGPTIVHPKTVAGCNLTLMHGVTLGGHRDGVPRIGDDVSIGTDAIVIGGITLGDRVTVGAGAVVTKDVPADYTVVGIPARPVWVREGDDSSMTVPAG